jgi:hypothetical protein
MAQKKAPLNTAAGPDGDDVEVVTAEDQHTEATGTDKSDPSADDVIKVDPSTVRGSAFGTPSYLDSDKAKGVSVAMRLKQIDARKAVGELVNPPGADNVGILYAAGLNLLASPNNFATVGTERTDALVAPLKVTRDIPGVDVGSVSAPTFVAIRGIHDSSLPMVYYIAFATEPDATGSVAVYLIYPSMFQIRMDLETGVYASRQFSVPQKSLRCTVFRAQASALKMFGGAGIACFAYRKNPALQTKLIADYNYTFDFLL